jgi:hypothetical protein
MHTQPLNSPKERIERGKGNKHEVHSALKQIIPVDRRNLTFWMPLAPWGYMGFCLASDWPLGLEELPDSHLSRASKSWAPFDLRKCVRRTVGRVRTGRRTKPGLRLNVSSGSPLYGVRWTLYHKVMSDQNQGGPAGGSTEGPQVRLWICLDDCLYTSLTCLA